MSHCDSHGYQYAHSSCAGGSDGSVGCESMDGGSFTGFDGGKGELDSNGCPRLAAMLEETMRVMVNRMLAISPLM